MANETWKFVQAKSKQAMKQVVGIRDEKTRMKVMPPLAVAPITLRRMMTCDGTALFPTLKGAARPITTYHHIKHAPATSHKNQINSYKLSNGCHRQRRCHLHARLLVSDL